MLIAAGERTGTVLAQMLEQLAERDAGSLDQLIVELAVLAAATQDEEQCRVAVNALLDGGPVGRVGLIRFFAEAVRTGRSLASIREQLSRSQQLRIDQMFAAARVTALDVNEPDSSRQEAIDLLALTSDATSLLGPLALDDRSEPVRLSTLSVLAMRREAGPWKQLLAEFSQELPNIRKAILDGVLARSDRINWLFDEIAAGKIKVVELGRHRTDRLINHPDSEIKARAQELLSEALSTNRQQVLADYQVALTMKSNAERGREVFRKNCAICHCIDNIGVNVAPDISDSRGKMPVQYLTDIIDPNRTIDSNYVNYTLITEGGRTFSGILATETSTSVTLKQAENEILTLRRDEIDELTSSGMSFMPEGLEKQIPHQAMADLIAFIKNWRYLDGFTPLRSNQFD